MKIASHVEGTKAVVYMDGITEGMTQEQVEEAVRKALSPGKDAAGPWISVKDALPGAMHTVLVQYEHSSYKHSRWSTSWATSDGHWAIEMASPQVRVTHWTEVRV